MKVPIKVSARHIHLAKRELAKLFGEDFSLEESKSVDQPGQFSAEQRLTIKGPKSSIENVAIVGPLRDRTQIEVSKTDAYNLGINPPIMESVSSSDEQPAEIELIGPKGSLTIAGAIIDHRHIHINSLQAEEKKLSNGQLVSVKTEGKRSLIFNNVLVRVDNNYDYSMHIDTDEANAAAIEIEDQGEIILDRSRATGKK
jgi:putative phosphotransacetylase